MEFTSLTVLSTIMNQLVDGMVEQPSEDTVVVPARWQDPAGWSMVFQEAVRALSQHPVSVLFLPRIPRSKSGSGSGTTHYYP